MLTRVMDDNNHYRSASFFLIFREGSGIQKSLVLGSWLFSILACIVLGLATVAFEWSGLPLQFGGVDVFVTFYPPLIICLLWTLLFGFWWGAIPAYLATLSLALFSGIPWYWAVLFACANPLGFAVYGVVYRTIPISLEMRDSSSILFFIMIAFFSSVLESTGALIWNHLHQLDAYTAFTVWQGWWLGGFLQKVCIFSPLLYLFWPRISHWREKMSWMISRPAMSRRNAITFGGVIAVAVFLFLFLTFSLTEELYQLAENSGNYAIAIEAFSVALQSVHAVYWIMSFTFVVVVVLGYQFYAYWISVLERAKELAEEKARTDYLTGLNNRRAFYESARVIHEHSVRYQHSYCVLLLDVDFFKMVNDKWGHDAGDKALIEVADTVKEAVRESDLCARFGGEEFIVLLPETSVIEAANLADRLREKMAAKIISLGEREEQQLKLTVSIGLAQLKDQALSIDQVINHADEAMYKAKSSGRNQVAIYSE